MAAPTLFVSHLPASASSADLEELFSEVGPVKRCFVVKEKGSEQCRGIGYVTYSMAEDAQRAQNEIKQFDGHKITVVQAKKKPRIKQRSKEAPQQTEDRKEVPENKCSEEPTKSKSSEEAPKKKSPQKAECIRTNAKKAKLIIRNLSFKCSEEDLKEIFSKFGTVLEVKIPLKPDGKKRGFAFVQFKNMLQAGKALVATNMKDIKDRQVAVDWALAKNKYVATQAGAASGNKNDLKNSKETDDNIDKDEPPKKKSKPQQKDDEEDDDDDDEDDDDEGDDDDEENNEDSDSEEDDDSQEADSDDSGSASDDEEEDDEDSIDDDDDDESDQKKKKKNKQKKSLPSDVNEGRTVFIRNLSFDSEEEGIEECLLQFGELNYVRVVVHPETGHSKGCAFAQFKSKEAAEKCLAAAENDSEVGGVRVDGRKLNIVLAVTRESATKLKTNKVKVHKGVRNLYLAREGLIRAGTKSAEGVSSTDMAKRARFEDLKRAKLKDVNVFVSRTRLCIHNLPKNVDRRRLIQLCKSAAGGGKGVIITECHVMYDRKPVRGEVVGKSLGYGFVEFKEHEHALQALRHLNNNPTIFTDNKRPIVEFSLEDGRKLKLKAMRQEKSKAKLAPGSAAEKNPSHKAGEQKAGIKKSSSPGKNKPAVQQPGGTKTSRKENKGVQSGHYSGFRTKPEVEHVELEDGKKRQKVLPMPSHRGPKIRHRDKGKQQPQSQKVKRGLSRKDRKVSVSLEKPNQNNKQSAKPGKRKARNKDNDRFDNLVAQYKNKLLGASSSKGSLIKKSKWFH